MFVLMYPPCLSYPLPASGSMYPRDLYPLLDWQERWLLTELHMRTCQRNAHGATASWQRRRETAARRVPRRIAMDDE